jgi:cytochrome c oxidase subunit 3
VTAEAHAMTTTAHAEPHEAASGHAQRGISNPILGMILFITSEVMFFSGLFAAYFATRAANQPWPPAAFKHILDPLGPIMIATILLIASSFTCQFAVWSIRKGDRKGFIRNISVTFVLGIIFLGMQVYDYSLLFGEGTIGPGATRRARYAGRRT